MKSALVIIDRAPYGCENAFSGLYIVIACLNSSLDADVLLMEDGVYAAVADQSQGPLDTQMLRNSPTLYSPRGVSLCMKDP